MYDNIYTKYEDASEMINSITAEAVIQKLEHEIKEDCVTAEKCAYLSKAYIFAGDDSLQSNLIKITHTDI